MATMEAALTMGKIESALEHTVKAGPGKRASRRALCLWDTQAEGGGGGRGVMRASTSAPLPCDCGGSLAHTAPRVRCPISHG